MEDNTITGQLKTIMSMVNELEELINNHHRLTMFELKRVQSLVQLQQDVDLENKGIDEVDQELEEAAQESHEQAYLDDISGVNN